MDKIIGIYVITNLINGNQYVGQSVDCHRRWADHYSKSYNSQKQDDLNKVLYKAMRKYKRENFSFQILETCERDSLNEREIFWIQKLDTYKNGYNETPGGEQVGNKNPHKGEEHGMAKLTEEDVIQCRKWYQEGKRCSEIWEQYYQNKIGRSGFGRMWHGKTWKHIMPEVFEVNPHPRYKFSAEDKQKIKDLYNEGYTCAQIYRIYEGKISRTSINDYCNNRR